jgi:hypothetical protein
MLLEIIINFHTLKTHLIWIKKNIYAIKIKIKQLIKIGNNN